MKYYKATNKQEKLLFGSVYHVYNKAISHDKLFITFNDYDFFLKKLDRFISPVADIIAYCLMPNHFHLLLEIKEEESLKQNFLKNSTDNPTELISKSFSNFFNSYAKSFNKAHQRSGRLFLYPYKRILVDDDGYFACLINYIHRNPVHHGLTKEYGDWNYSSYKLYFSDKATFINREKGLAPFQTLEAFFRFHEENKVSPGIEKYSFE